jgi:hypothetical protein
VRPVAKSTGEVVLDDFVGGGEVLVLLVRADDGRVGEHRHRDRETENDEPRAE